MFGDEYRSVLLLYPVFCEGKGRYNTTIFLPSVEAKIDIKALEWNKKK